MDKNFTDEELVAVIQSGGSPGKELLSGTIISVEDAWATLVDRYDHQDPENLDVCKSDLEKRAIGYWHGNRANAQDTVARTWGKVFDNIDNVKDNFRGWIFTILKNQFLDEWRKNKRWDEEGDDEGRRWIGKVELIPLGAQDEDREGKNDPVELEMNKVNAAASAEQTYFDEAEGSGANYQNLIRKFLSKGEAGFFLDYQAGLALKVDKDKVKYLRLKPKLVKNMITQWVTSGRTLDDIMSPRQAKALRVKYSLGQRDADTLKEQGITDKEELYQLLATGAALLLQAYLYNEGLDI